MADWADQENVFEYHEKNMFIKEMSVLMNVTFYSFFTSPYQPFILEAGRTSIALNADDVR